MRSENFNRLLVMILSSTIGFIISIQIDIHLSMRIAIRFKKDSTPDISFSVAVISIHAFLIDLITPNLNTDSTKIIE